jgi:hypothetical protein
LSIFFCFEASSKQQIHLLNDIDPSQKSFVGVMSLAKKSEAGNEVTREHRHPARLLANKLVLQLENAPEVTGMVPFVKSRNKCSL